MRAALPATPIAHPLPLRAHRQHPALLSGPQDPPERPDIASLVAALESAEPASNLGQPPSPSALRRARICRTHTLHSACSIKQSHLRRVAAHRSPALCARRWRAARCMPASGSAAIAGTTRNRLRSSGEPRAAARLPLSMPSVSCATRDMDGRWMAVRGARSALQRRISGSCPSRCLAGCVLCSQTHA